MKKKFLCVLMSAVLMLFAAVQTSPVFDTNANAAEVQPRQMEYLDRGTVAVKISNGVYISWRLLGTENYDTGFDVYRTASSGAVTKVGENITDSTNFTYKGGLAADKYTVVKTGENADTGKAVDVWGQQYKDIPLGRIPSAASLPKFVTENKWNYFVDSSGNKVSSDGWRNPETAYQDVAYTIGDTSVGDLDGDGEYELVVKWDCGGQDNSYNGVTGNVIIDAYELDGTPMWENPIDLGINIRAGAHYTQFLVYDFDFDGKAEITMKTAPGSKDGTDKYVTAASHVNDIKNVTDEQNSVDYRNNDGYILEGDEYFTIFDGETGAALDTIYYPVQRISASVWGDTQGNRVDRFTASVAYLDGVKPYAVYLRGYYMGRDSQQRSGTCAMSFDGTNLSCDYCFDTYNTSGTQGYKGMNGYYSGAEIYVGQGNHNCAVADVDGDGKDEFLTGALCLEVDDSGRLKPRWCTFMEHGDALHLADYDPTHDGMEFYTVHEDSGPNTKSGKSIEINYGMSVIDPYDGSIIKHWTAGGDTGRGIMANTGMGGYYQVHAYAGSGRQVGPEMMMGNGVFETAPANLTQNFRVFWDDDVYDEFLDGTNITNWNGYGFSAALNAGNYGCISINGTKANPALQADILGDWREEVIYPYSDNTKLRIFTATTETTHRLYTLMHDSAYRMQVSSQQTAYNQPPHIGYYVSEDNDIYDRRKFAAYVKTVDDDGNELVRTENIPGSDEDVPPTPRPTATPTPETNKQTITATKVRNEIGSGVSPRPVDGQVWLNSYKNTWGAAYFGFSGIEDFDPTRVTSASIEFTAISYATTSKDRQFYFKLIGTDNSWESGIVTVSSDPNPSGKETIYSQSCQTKNGNGDVFQPGKATKINITDYVKTIAKGTTEISVIAAIPSGSGGAGACELLMYNDPTLTIDMIPEPIPTPTPTATPTVEPTATPTVEPTASPTIEPTATPTVEPTVTPTVEPTATPTIEPTASPTVEPTATPTIEPTVTPTIEPTATPTIEPTATPTIEPTATPTVEPTATPIIEPTTTPTIEPTATPTVEPTATPIIEPTTTPTIEPTATPTVEPTATPTIEPTATPTIEPTAMPTVEPTATPTIEPTATPTIEPTASPTVEPTAAPTIEPTTAPTIEPTTTPTLEPTESPTIEPTVLPTTEPVQYGIEVLSEPRFADGVISGTVSARTAGIKSRMKLILAVYDETGALKHIQIKDGDISGGDIAFDTFEISGHGECSYAVFAWEDLTEIKSLCAPVKKVIHEETR